MTLTGGRDRSDTQAPHYDGSFYNIYSDAALAAANANPATASAYPLTPNPAMTALAFASRNGA